MKPAPPVTRARTGSASCPLPICSPTNGIHRPFRLDEPRFVNRMAFPLGPHRVPQRLRQLLIGGAAPQQGAQVELVHRKEAVADFAVRGEADAVAMAAERPADGGNDAELA